MCALVWAGLSGEVAGFKASASIDILFRNYFPLVERLELSRVQSIVRSRLDQYAFRPSDCLMILLALSTPQ